MGFLDTILNILFPAKCLECNKAGVDICLECLKGAPAAERECENWIFPLYDYRHPSIKKSLWLLKYKGKKRLANVFAEIIYEKILEELSELMVLENFREPLLIPIPLSHKRYRERGYNQAELISGKIIEINNSRSKLNLKLKNNILIKNKETEHQARIKDRRIRLKNLTDSFSVHNTDLIKNKNIILIDDITTTGATLNEAKKVLKKAGVHKVIAFTIAH